MSLINSGSMGAADLAAVMGNRDGFGGDGLLFLLFILILWGGNNGNWGNNGTNNEIQRGFDQQAVMSGINAVQAEVSALSASQMAQMNTLAMSLQNCCCENRLASANLNATILSEGCSTRQAFNDGLRDLMAQNVANTQAIVNSQNAGFQGLMDKICQLELDAKNDKIADLQRQLSYQQAVADNAAQTTVLLNAINQQNACLCGC